METYFENVQILTDLFEGIEGYVKKFKRDSYAAAFEEFINQKKSFLDEVSSYLSKMEDGIDEKSIQELSKQISESFQKLLNNKKTKGDKLTVQLNGNLYMAVYVLPAINSLELKGTKELTECICKAWSETFKDSEIKASTFDSIQAGFRKKLCYITTAVCQSIHKENDCKELAIIKDFRDGYLESTEDGKKLVEEYYNIAPTIVKRINRSENAEDKYRWLWETYLRPCVEYIQMQNPEKCKETYCNMVEELQKEYMGGKHE